MKKLILASTSFRRQELLKWTGLVFEIIAPNFEEAQLSRSSFPSTATFVEALSFGKAFSVVDHFPDAVIISGDTLVDCDGEAIGKPKDLDDARNILRKLSDRTHLIFSGVTVTDSSSGKTLTQSIESAVTFKKLSEVQIEKYIQTGESLGKAGAYGLQSGARPFLDHLEGSWTNVIGFPLVKVVEMLSEFEIQVPVNIHAVIEKYLGVKE
ncbi:MAG: Maf family protein [Patescibacteria group bacterium]